MARAEIEPKRIPSNPEAERSLVGSLLTYPDELARLRPVVSADDFYSELPRRAYLAICAIADSGGTPTLPVLAERGLAPQELVELSRAAVVSPAELDRLAAIVREHARRRALLRLARDLSTRAYDEAVTSDEAVAYVEAALADLRKGAQAQWITNSDLMLHHFEVLEERYNAGGVIGVKTGFPDLDEHLGGLIPGNLIFIAATPKTGKTSAALHIAMNSGVQCLFFTLEMLPAELADRQLAVKARVPAKQLRTGKLDDDAWRRLGWALPVVSDLPLAFAWQSGLSVSDIRAICQAYKAQHGLGLVIIDQLDKIYEPRDPGENDTTRIGRVTRGLKNLARDLDVPVVCLAQLLDKQIAQRAIPRPQHGDIRDSSYPDQDADVVLYLWRPSLYWPEEERWRNLVEIIIARSRATEEGSVWVRWEPQYTLFSLLDRESWPKGEYTRSGSGATAGTGARQRR